jgi:hypothetical protein
MTRRTRTRPKTRCVGQEGTRKGTGRLARWNYAAWRGAATVAGQDEADRPEKRKTERQRYRDRGEELVMSTPLFFRTARTGGSEIVDLHV